MEWLYEDRETEESMGLEKPRKESGKRLSKEMVHTSSFFFFLLLITEMQIMYLLSAY
jgi:hypothetical protein